MPPKPAPPANFPALRHYAQISHTTLHTRTLIPTISRESLLAEQTVRDAKLTEAITALRRRILDEEMTLSTLQPEPTPALEIPEQPDAKLSKLRALKTAHDQGFAGVDYIPSADSPLNELLAYRSVQRVIAQTVASLEVVEKRLSAARGVLREEEGVAVEQKRLMEALQGRVGVLEEEGGGGGEGGRDVVREMGKRRKELARKTVQLLRELLYFLETGLARMVAAEEMGGPVVGEDLEVALEMGFDKKGRARKGERRIDEMWGQAEEDPEKRMVREFKDLLEELMNASLEASPYVELEKDTAIARFLVRAKVAVFHPKDARRLKLVDFGSNVEDG